MTWSSVRVPSTSSCSRRARTSGLAALPESLARRAGAAATPRTRRVRKRARRLASALGSGPTFHPPTRPTTAASSRVRAPREPSRRGTSAEVRLRGACRRRNSRPGRGPTTGVSAAAGCGSSRASVIPNPPPAPAHLSRRERELFRAGVARARVDAMAALRRRAGRALGAPRRACRDRPGVVGVHAAERARAATRDDAAGAGGRRRHARARRRSACPRGAAAGARQRRSKLSPDVRRELARLRRDDPLGALDDDETIP